MHSAEIKFVRRKRNRSPIGSLSCALAMICSACGGGETQGDPQQPVPDAGANVDAPSSVDAAPAADGTVTDNVAVGQVTEIAAQAICDALYRCCDAGDREIYFAPYRANELLAAFHSLLPPEAELREEDCPGVVRQMLDITPLGDWVTHAQAGLVTFLPEAFASCATRLQAAQCGADVRGALHDGTCLGFAAPSGGSEQRSFFERTGAAGAACAPIRDGVGAGFYGTCDPTSHFCCYVNESQPELGCTYPFDGEGVPRAGSCTPASGVGQPCTVALPIQICATGLSCDYDTATCLASSEETLAVGDTCVDESWNLLGDCADSWCDLLGSSKCEPLKDNGASCSAAYECAAGACLDYQCGEPTMCVAPDQSDGPDAGIPDAGADPDAGTSDPVDSGMTAGSGETCEDAIDLVAASAAGGGSFANQVAGTFGSSDDYNPQQDSGLPPGCSIVYDASGQEVVYAVELEPGDTLSLRYTVTPNTSPGGLYLLDSCTPPAWPDYDGSGMCGSNEYVSQGYCGYLGCDPLSFSFYYPTELQGTPTSPKVFWVVLDEVGGAAATGYQLEWEID